MLGWSTGSREVPLAAELSLCSGHAGSWRGHRHLLGSRGGSGPAAPTLSRPEPTVGGDDGDAISKG